MNHCISTVFVLTIFIVPPIVASASNIEIESYTPPPMFGETIALTDDNDAPPLPPKRPAKFQVPASYIEKLMHRENLSQQSLENKIVDQNAHDVLKAIHPQ